MNHSFLPVALAAVVPRLLLAQPTASASAPRPFFVELQSASADYEIHYLTTDSETLISSFPLAVGYYFTSRLAVQFSGAYGHTSNGGLTSIRNTPDGVYNRYYKEEHEHAAIPILLHYALFKRRFPLRADALVGAAWVHDSFVYDTWASFTNQGSATSIPLGERSFSDKGSQFFVTAGASLRWVFNRHFELVGDRAWNRNLKEVPEYIHQQVTGNKYGLTTSKSIALRYRFNLRKPAAR